MFRIRFVVFYVTSLVVMSILAALCQPAIVNAERVDPSDRELSVDILEPVVVSATKTPVPLSQVTSAAEVITGEELEAKKIKTVVEALRLSQGTAVFSNGGPGTVSSVRIRGGSSQQTLVIIDGAIVNSGTLGQFNFANMTAENIERIEILRGAQSMVWGADAMGGVINIVTKRGKGAFRTGLFLEYGSFNTLREGGSVSGQHGPFDVSLALSRWDTSNISAINFRRGASERDSFRNWQASSRLGLNLPYDGRFDFNFRWWNSDSQVDSSSGPSDVIKARSDSQQFIWSGTYTQPITNWWSHTVTVSRAQEASPFDPGILQRNLSTGAMSVPFGGPNETRVVTNRIESQHNVQVGEHALLTLGYQFREQQGENDTGLTNRLVASHAGFAQLQIKASDRVLATAGVRQDSFNVFGDATTYRVTGGYLHKETDTKIRTSYSTGFRAPTINELFFPDFGNPTLQPEKSQSFDVGLDQALFKKRLVISGGYFWNRFRGLIETIQNAAICGAGPFGANFCPVNVSTAKSQGWETSIQLLLAEDLPFVKRLQLKGQYTMTLTRNLQTARRLARWPVDQASIQVWYQPLAPVNVLIDFRFVGSQFNNPSLAQNDTQRVGSFEVVNLTASLDISSQLQVYLRADNVFDEDFEEVLFFGTPGRSIFGGIRLDFDVPLFRSGSAKPSSQ